MAAKIDLIWLQDANGPTPDWTLGEVWTAHLTPDDVNSVIQQKLVQSDADAWLFWHSELGVPDSDQIESVFALPGHVWHAGLMLGMGGAPGIIDFVNPTWMVNRDPDSTIEATSWRLSLRACLVSVDVLRQMGGIRSEFLTLDAAGLEMGHRYITKGVLVRHIPWMIPSQERKQSINLPFEDELRFAFYGYGNRHTYWALLRVVLSGYAAPLKAFRTWRSVRASAKSASVKIYAYSDKANHLQADYQAWKVSVIIPTIDRYPYLRTLLKQMREQTVKPHEIIIVDQTEIQNRDASIANDYADLPLKVLYQDKPGQCTSRNAALQMSGGDFILFIDDDDEIEPDLIEQHLQNLHHFKIDVSCGAADEVGAGPLPPEFAYMRTSDVFPTNNTMIRRDVLRQSGLFDLAYDHRKRADGDLGTRVYLTGAFMLFDPNISVLHHHAPKGGLRVHKARIITYASSRQRLFHRHLPSVSEIYLAKRYFTPRQVRESIWLRVFGTYSFRGQIHRKLLKAAVSTVLLPDTLWRIRKRYQQAEDLLHEFPQIPSFDSTVQTALEYQT